VSRPGVWKIGNPESGNETGTGPENGTRAISIGIILRVLLTIALVRLFISLRISNACK